MPGTFRGVTKRGSAVGVGLFLVWSYKTENPILNSALCYISFEWEFRKIFTSGFSQGGRPEFLVPFGKMMRTLLFGAFIPM